MQRPYARPATWKVVSQSSVWFTAYLASTIGPTEDIKPLKTLCDPEIWKLLTKLGVNGVHTGPVLRAGGLRPSGDGVLEAYPTIDGWFDPISFAIDGLLGDAAPNPVSQAAKQPPEAAEDAEMNDYECLTRSLRRDFRVKVIGDIIPGHTGMGPDFQLALRGFELYPGLYLLARIDDKFHLLDSNIREQLENMQFRPDEFSRTLDLAQVNELRKKDIIPGSPQRPMGAEAAFGWSITREIDGVAGQGASGECDLDRQETRRWVYLHFFNPQQPTLNWIDPGFAAWRLVIGQLNYLIWQLRSDGVRLDANSFLGIEIIPESTDTKVIERVSDDCFQTWSEAHPLSELATNMLAWQARRLDGFSFQEMNMAMPELAKFAELGPDLAYDFITRPAAEHALLTGCADLLNLMFSEMEEHSVNPLSLVHALQNHDDLTYELVHFRANEGRTFFLGDEELPAFNAEDARREHLEWRRPRQSQVGPAAAEIGDEDEQASVSSAPFSIWGRVRDEMYKYAVVDRGFNCRSDNGLCTTLAGLIAARLGCTSLDELVVDNIPTDGDDGLRSALEQKNKAAITKRDRIKIGHLLLAAFNAFMPGVFALSGWDLVGALPLDSRGIRPELLYSGLSREKADGEPRAEDFRWVNRGAYKLLSSYMGNGNMEATETEYGPLRIREARALYGPIDRQIEDGFSFYSQLRRILAVRDLLGIHLGQFGGTLDLGYPQVFGMFTWLPAESRSARSAAIALFNFSKDELHKVSCNPQRLDGWSKYWKKRWDKNGNRSTLTELEGQRELASLRRWQMFDAFPSASDYDPKAPTTKRMSINSVVEIEPWNFKLFHLRPTW